MTNTLQRRGRYCDHHAQTPDLFFNSLCSSYLWNKELINNIDSCQRHEYAIPVIRGFVGTKTLNICKDQILTILQIARISSQNTGTYSHSNGVDGDGNASCMVETETILVTSDYYAAHVQVRGSHPLKWTMVYPENTAESMQIVVSDDAESAKLCRDHFQRYSNVYGRSMTIVQPIKILHIGRSISGG